MLYNLVRHKTNIWLQSPDCPITSLLAYIRSKGELRPPQVEAVETYLFLKIEGNNKPLYQLFEGDFFHTDLDLDALPLTATTRDYLRNHPGARSLYEFARQSADGGNRLLPELVTQIEENPTGVPYAEVIRQLFYEVSYPDYLFSLPMGSGKTFLMAAFMYLDLYFAYLNPDDERFAHNFLVLIPNGLKTSLVPSLRTIEHFDPSWVIESPAAEELRQLVRLEVLDESKSAKKSNKVRNPNAQRVNHYLAEPGLLGLILVVNAEKVILDRMPANPAQLELLEHSDDDKDRQANELRNIIGKLPRLALHIDEVQNAATNRVKLRQVVTKWHEQGNITNVLGYSGTPYLGTAQEIVVNAALRLRLTHITNTVYYYPLLQAVRTFLKTPIIKTATNLDSEEIIRRGVREFEERYGNHHYANGTTAKMAIYCSSIERLEETVFPLLTGELGIPPDDILKLHQGKAATKAKDGQPARPGYPITAEARRDFALLDHPLSHKRYVLLVQIGREGWDCRSLTGVILSQQGDSPPNMVLQTSCRCLRQVERGQPETALIWLNQFNYNTLNNQLQAEQHTSIAELTSAANGASIPIVRRSRVAHLQLPKLAFYQLRVRYDEQLPDQQPDPAQQFTDLLAILRQRQLPYFIPRTITTTILTEAGTNGASLGTAAPTENITVLGNSELSFTGWLRSIIRDSFGTLTPATLHEHQSVLRQLYEELTFTSADPDRLPILNEAFDLPVVEARIRRAFTPLRELRQHEETLSQQASLLLADKLTPIMPPANVYPAPNLAEQIIRLDETGRSIAELEAQRQAANQQLRDNFIPPDPSEYFAPQQPNQHPEFPFEVKRKDRSFHYIPYEFSKSDFERKFLKGVLDLPELDTHDLEVYFNGEGHLTEFRIKCYFQTGPNHQWRYVGRYTPDFLLVQRKNGELHRVLIIETKGQGFAEQEAFQQRRDFVENDFLSRNEQAFGYRRFDFLYLPDSTPLNSLMSQLVHRINTFFV